MLYSTTNPMYSIACLCMCIPAACLTGQLGVHEQGPPGEVLEQQHRAQRAQEDTARLHGGMSHSTAVACRINNVLCSPAVAGALPKCLALSTHARSCAGTACMLWPCACTVLRAQQGAVQRRKGCRCRMCSRVLVLRTACALVNRYMCAGRAGQSHAC